MQCAVCGTGDELLYTCGRCGEALCATHHGRPYHQCAPGPDGDWIPPGARDPTTGGGSGLADHADAAPSVDRPRAQRFPDAAAADAAGPDVDSQAEPPDVDSQADSTDPDNVATGAGTGATTGTTTEGNSTAAIPPDAIRPGYGPDSPRPEPVEPADTLGEWFRRQTYVSLSLKVGFVATLSSAFVFSSLIVGLSVVGA